MDHNPLRSLTLMVASHSAPFVDTWSSVLDTAGSILARALHKSVFAVIADRDVDPRIVERAVELNVPVVNSEWAAQCLINWRLVSLNQSCYKLKSLN